MFFEDVTPKLVGMCFRDSKKAFKRFWEGGISLFFVNSYFCIHTKKNFFPKKTAVKPYCFFQEILEEIFVEKIFLYGRFFKNGWPKF